MDSMEVTSSHGVKLTMDDLFDESAYDADVVVLPGGMPGASALRSDQRVIDILKDFNQKGKWIAAICAGPISLEKAGVIENKQFTCYPGSVYYTHLDVYKRQLMHHLLKLLNG